MAVATKAGAFGSSCAYRHRADRRSRDWAPCAAISAITIVVGRRGALGPNLDSKRRLGGRKFGRVGR